MSNDDIPTLPTRTERIGSVLEVVGEATVVLGGVAIFLAAASFFGITAYRTLVGETSSDHLRAPMGVLMSGAFLLMCGGGVKFVGMVLRPIDNEEDEE